MFEHEELFGGSWIGAYSALCFSCGYFAYDQLDMLRYRLYSGWIPGILMHHLILLICFTLAQYRNVTINYLILSLVCEVHLSLLILGRHLLFMLEIKLCPLFYHLFQALTFLLTFHWRNTCTAKGNACHRIFWAIDPSLLLSLQTGNYCNFVTKYNISQYIVVCTSFNPNSVAMNLKYKLYAFSLYMVAQMTIWL